MHSSDWLAKHSPVPCCSGYKQHAAQQMSVLPLRSVHKSPARVALMQLRRSLSNHVSACWHCCSMLRQRMPPSNARVRQIHQCRQTPAQLLHHVAALLQHLAVRQQEQDQAAHNRATAWRGVAAATMMARACSSAGCANVCCHRMHCAAAGVSCASATVLRVQGARLAWPRWKSLRLQGRAMACSP